MHNVNHDNSQSKDSIPRVAAGGVFWQDSKHLWINFAGVDKHVREKRVQKRHETPVHFLPTYQLDFPDDALYGLAGDIVKKLLPETEAHPAALLLHILTRFGNLVGRTSYYQVEATHQYPNLFVVPVGSTAKARKGTASDRIEEIFQGIDMGWEETRQLSGFGSGEGVINAVRDDQEGTIKGKPYLIPGVEDKRLFIREGEFSRVLAVASREGNLLSQVMRDGWDGKSLRNTTRNNPQTATDPHISAICDITQAELELSLAEADRYNGFANRFLWVFVERTKLKPFGGNPIDWKYEREQLRKAWLAAHRPQRIFMTEAARTMWRRNYAELSAARDGIVGGITSRAETQVLRLALIYALLDQRDQIDSVHLRAALELWDYCVRSVLHIFGKHGFITAEQQKILDRASNGPTSFKEFREEVFKRNRPAALIYADLEALVKKNRLSKERDEQNQCDVWCWK